ncbi:hypothetical protein ONZ43_g6786 [Nemania bipapillata]|uniref:Uncharacterized protein n=1 Tax=Nemania bipapillata TaxID=110536 RepID=A0ACC2HWW5_9PEZI|nr:hypothetical protein ONZ43_g6786 [Nemania bipapillata]
MRLRQSNKKKRFGLPDYGLDLDASDADSTLPRADSSEDEFVVDATAGDGEEADETPSEQDEEDDDHDDNDDNDFNDSARRSAVRAVKTAKTAKARTKTPGRSKEDQIDKAENTFAEVPPYPSDPGQRWTRTYIGPIKRWTRFYELVDWWFGDKPDRRVILDGFLKLWWPHELIPPKLTSRPRLLIAQNAWMPENFADDQRFKFRRLYSSRLIHQFRQQVSTSINKVEALRWSVPQAQRGLGVLLGHVSDQKLHYIQPWESIPFSDAGHPIGDTDGETTATGGWLLDVGGIPISIAWAPTQGQVSQLLAVAIAPFSDQVYNQDLKDSPKELEQKEEQDDHQSFGKYFFPVL